MYDKMPKSRTKCQKVGKVGHLDTLNKNLWWNRIYCVSLQVMSCLRAPVLHNLAYLKIVYNINCDRATVEQGARYKNQNYRRG